ncbi:hypothetical protein scyTo_0000210 [Scyliorhinus torazame]|uniref:Uncharacterized protein n=1 Tax=Scyliorhinus torazame TaxID=75743 RepID=A0A401NSN1_SCYTO|nr:hypothetical protein [Scyliorhinus torazame]
MPLNVRPRLSSLHAEPCEQHRKQEGRELHVYYCGYCLTDNRIAYSKRELQETTDKKEIGLIIKLLEEVTRNPIASGKCWAI